MKKRVLIASDTFLPKIDGVSIFLSKVIPDLSKYFKITLIVPNYKNKLKFKSIKNVEIVRTKISSLQIANYNVPLPKRKIIKNLVKNSDIVWIQSIGPIGHSALKYAKKFNKKTIAYIHTIEEKRFPRVTETTSRLRLFFRGIVRLYEQNFYNQCDKLMVASKSISDILDNEGITTKKIIVPMGLDTKQFKPVDEKTKLRLRKKFGIKKDTFVIGYVGRISKEKHLETLRDAFNKFPLENKLLLIVGGGSYLQKRIFNGDKNIKITNFVKDVVPYLQIMDVYVLPSYTETTSISTLEAMSTGLPVAATPVGSVKNYIINGYNGMFFEIGDKKTLIKILLKLYENKELRIKLGKNARKTVSKFSWKATVSKIKKGFNSN
ncbi:MAG: glycosyltransferase [Candidatus Nanoarchaeia archaeon]|nr:glycosyltransferase [Candidatus Nanoarchaeia archaeon]MDD5588232.1 glycosyltransferase [Candidatus Nanoarchaeia archaeon]